MDNLTSFRSKVVLTALAAFVVSSTAWAYIPPSFFIVKSVAAKHDGLKGLRIRSSVSAGDGGGARFKAIAHYNPQNGVLRAYALDDNGQKLYAVERRTESAPAAAALLFWSNPRNLALALKAKGIPVRIDSELAKLANEDERRAAETEHLARWFGKIAWVIGGKESSKGDAKQAQNEPQLWVEKDSFIPLRLVAAPAEDASGGLVDLQFENTRFTHEFPYPRVIIGTKRDQPLFRDEVKDVSTVLDAAEFKSHVSPGFTEAGNAAPSGVRALIQAYFGTVR